jgi:hypothetical protein
MEFFDSQMAGMAVITTGVGAMMVWLAARMNAVEMEERRRCPACGVRPARRSRCGCFK